MRFVFMLHCKANNGTRQVGNNRFFCIWIALSCILCSGPDWLYKTDFIDYYGNLARFIEPSAGRNQWLFYA